MELHKFDQFFRVEEGTGEGLLEIPDCPESTNTQVVSTPISSEHHDGDMLRDPTFINGVFP